MEEESEHTMKNRRPSLRAHRERPLLPCPDLNKTDTYSDEVRYSYTEAIDPSHKAMSHEAFPSVTALETKNCPPGNAVDTNETSRKSLEKTEPLN